MKAPRLTMQSLHILRSIHARGPQGMTGLQICSDTGYATGTVYPLLRTFVDAGWLKAEPRTFDHVTIKCHTLTNEGFRHLAAAAAKLGMGL